MNREQKESLGIAVAVAGLAAMFLLQRSQAAERGGGGNLGGDIAGLPSIPSSGGGAGSPVINIDWPAQPDRPFEFSETPTKKEDAQAQPVVTKFYPEIGRTEYNTGYYTVPQVLWAMPIDINPATGEGYSVPVSKKEQQALMDADRSSSSTKTSPGFFSRLGSFFAEGLKPQVIYQPKKSQQTASAPTFTPLTQQQVTTIAKNLAMPNYSIPSKKQTTYQAGPLGDRGSIVDVQKLIEASKYKSHYSGGSGSGFYINTSGDIVNRGKTTHTQSSTGTGTWF